MRNLYIQGAGPAGGQGDSRSLGKAGRVNSKRSCQPTGPVRGKVASLLIIETGIVTDLYT